MTTSVNKGELHHFDMDLTREQETLTKRFLTKKSYDKKIYWFQQVNPQWKKAVVLSHMELIHNFAMVTGSDDQCTNQLQKIHSGHFPLNTIVFDLFGEEVPWKTMLLAKRGLIWTGDNFVDIAMPHVLVFSEVPPPSYASKFVNFETLGRPIIYGWFDHFSRASSKTYWDDTDIQLVKVTHVSADRNAFPDMKNRDSCFVGKLSHVFE